MLKLEGQSCVIVGGGQVAARKVRSLLQVGASITIISPEVEPMIQELSEHGHIRWRQQSYSSGMLQPLKPLLVFAATDSNEINEMVADEVRELGVLVNVVDGETPGNFTNMAIIERAPITIGISTNGTSPALVKHITTMIQQLIGEEYTTLSQWLGELREPLKLRIPEQAQRQAIYEAVIESDILALLQQGHVEQAHQRFLQITGQQVFD